MDNIKVEDGYCSLQYEFDLFLEAIKSGSKSELSLGNKQFYEFLHNSNFGPGR